MITNKMGEADIEFPILSILDRYGPLTTAQLKPRFRNFTVPTGANLKPLLNRSDQAIDQIVGNIVSHRNDRPNNMIFRGLIDYSSTGVLSITNKGRNYLDKLSRILYAKSME